VLKVSHVEIVFPVKDDDEVSYVNAYVVHEQVERPL